MTRSLLVAYATKHGSTRQVAEAIAGVLDERGFHPTVAAAADVDDLDGYDGVVLGSALYMGRLHGDARRFLRRQHRALAALPVAIFAMGPLTTDDHDVEGSRRQLEHALERVADVAPTATAIFGGVVDPEKLHFPFSQMPASDARDWDAVEAWAGEVAELFAGRYVAA